ncbi:PREDICTED: tyrosine--tRNA ligase 1, cytoplasmic-like [Nicotiana attenuata]|uniref:tyrosine--tRNA ligase 1, cytoplasmic-like n=1 Tax=Nicotiana attenuata TaxID=49451 RepID=UPI00090469E2|nr:PREDICTED: tyrosine--tRNA ligase 1, cytoplasmic-like [Nicotiana attenuata]
MGGDLKKIEVVGEYLIELWKSVGMNLEGGQVEFLWSSKEINSRAHEYWPLVMDIARRNKLPRIKNSLSSAKRINMLPGLQEGQEKMSKSDPSSSIYMEDEEADVNLKIKKAFCPPKVVEKNPCLEYIKYIVIPWFNEFKIERSAENGGDKCPPDSFKFDMQQVRDHFKNDQKAKDLMKRVKSFKQHGNFQSDVYVHLSSSAIHVDVFHEISPDFTPTICLPLYLLWNFLRELLLEIIDFLSLSV